MTKYPESPDFHPGTERPVPIRARQSLAEAALGITDPTNHQLALQQARAVLVGTDPYDDFSKQDKYELDTSNTIVEDMIGQGRIRFSNVLTDWPNYSRLMGQYGEKQDGSGTALLIGSLTPLSSRAFHTLAPDEFGIDKTLIVDPEGGELKARQRLIYASGMELPFPAESMDVVMTNQLLHMLRDPRSRRQSFRKNSSRLFSEIGRVLKPGGQVLMQEIPPGYTEKWSANKDIRRAIKLAVHIGRKMSQNGIAISGMRAQEVFVDNDYLFDPNRDFDRARYKVPTLTVHGRRKP